ncbi:putative bifunctional diguanylate cyclase/phosphodiesterase [Rheinheimera baltica]|uniref:putative bifunctional diguanylate cyclase/phosphodiesterase n=1 Tax=Rheinheimera baltica TaxID=67576 RepID=UPI0004271CF2|nr:GGDEF domain-containing phosphodiesterase [Rheinheimera baltica]
MPLSRWLLIAASFFSVPSFADAVDFDVYTSLPFAVLIILVLSLTLYNRKLQHRNQLVIEQQQTLQGFLQHSDDAIAILDQNLLPIYINPRLATYCGTAVTPAKRLPLYLDKDGSQLLLPKLNLTANWHGEAWLKTANSEASSMLSVAITRLQQTPPSYLLIGRELCSLTQTAGDTQSGSLRDNQTGLINRNTLSEYLHTCASFSNNQNPTFALLLLKFNQLLNADGVKPVLFLSDIIAELSRQLQKIIPDGHILARYSNDTFAIVIPPHLCHVQLEVQLNRLTQKMLLLPAKVTETRNNISLQPLIGISIYPLDGKEPAELLLAASTALSNIARLGHSGLQFANSKFQQRAPEFRLLELELKKAMLQGEFDVYYQPRMSIGSNRVIGYEALLRWHNPKRGVLLPQYFMALADETGMIADLDKLVFKKCCQQLQYWQKTGLDRGRIALNISNFSFSQPDFVSTLTQQLSVTDLKAEQFELELHEDILLQSDANTLSTLQNLAKIGFHLTLDNFGAGISSLSVLRNYPLHSLKISPEYIQNMEHNEQQRNLTATLIRLASYLQLDVISTGIENEMQAYLLHVMGCDILQGHLFSKALPASEIPALLAKENKLLRKAIN